MSNFGNFLDYSLQMYARRLSVSREVMYYIVSSLWMEWTLYRETIDHFCWASVTKKLRIILCNYPFKRNIGPNVSCYEDPDAISIFKNVRLQADQNFIIWLQVWARFSYVCSAYDSKYFWALNMFKTDSMQNQPVKYYFTFL